MFEYSKQALLQKNDVRRRAERRRKAELQELRSNSEYRAALSKSLSEISTLLESQSVKSILIEVDTKRIAQFTEAQYTADLADYDIEQLGKPGLFRITRKVIWM